MAVADTEVVCLQERVVVAGTAAVLDTDTAAVGVVLAHTVDIAMDSAVAVVV